MSASESIAGHFVALWCKGPKEVEEQCSKEGPKHIMPVEAPLGGEGLCEFPCKQAHDGNGICGDVPLAIEPCVGPVIVAASRDKHYEQRRYANAGKEIGRTAQEVYHYCLMAVVVGPQVILHKLERQKAHGKEKQPVVFGSASDVHAVVIENGTLVRLRLM
jgi:hypothetical protein